MANTKMEYQYIKSLEGKAVKFTTLILEHTVDFDPNMIARITKVARRDHGIKIWFDMSKYHKHNVKHMVPNFFDDNGEPNMTWIESGLYPADGIESCWFDTSDVIPFEKI